MLNLEQYVFFLLSLKRRDKGVGPLQVNPRIDGRI